MTKKLYDEDSHRKEFTAEVLSCVPKGSYYEILLDQTAFFPEGGGQLADTGMLGGVSVIDVQEKQEGILHTVQSPLMTGSTVEGKIDWELRFRRMQSHSGEHVVSGLIHQLFGYNNVGFHMGERDVTIDFDGELTREELNHIEELANRVVTSNVPVTAEYPPPEMLEKLEYRSKLELTENIRIVSIPGCDVCACCAPHVARTGEIGFIKLLDFMRHRGGVRIRMVCGQAALEDYRNKFENITAISALLSAKQEKAAAAVERLNRELQETRGQLLEVQRELLRLKLEQLPYTAGNLCLFETDLDSAMLRELVNGGMERCGGICAGFAGKDGAYRYVMGSRTVNLQARAKKINSALHGKGGGIPEMIQGSVSCGRKEIEEFFSQN